MSDGSAHDTRTLLTAGPVSTADAPATPDGDWRGLVGRRGDTTDHRVDAVPRRRRGRCLASTSAFASVCASAASVDALLAYAIASVSFVVSLPCAAAK